MDFFAVNIKWVDPYGQGIISTFIYKGLSTGEAEKKASVGFKKFLEKRYGYYDAEDMPIISTSTEIVKTGLFSERSWQVR